MAKLILKPQPKETDVNRLAGQLNVSNTIATLLAQRGFDDAQKAEEFLYGSAQNMSDPFLLSGMKDAAQQIVKHIQKGSKIVIYGDYDCDGIGATAILVLTLRQMGAKVDYFIPERKSDGYGIGRAALERVMAKNAPNLIVSVDCGVSSAQEIGFAKQTYGVDFIITDHHELPETLPDCTLVNPHLDHGTEFSGAGVALKLSEALIGREAALRYVDICALSTVADVVPLTKENRIIVKEGLKKFNKRDIRPGLAELLRVSGIEASSKITSYDIAFKLAPRINASGRLESAEKSLELLLDEDVSNLRLVANALNEDNLLRQEMTDAVAKSAKEMLKNYDLCAARCIVLANSEWDAGVLGIAAARLTEAFLRPAILLTEKDGIYTGSARSVSGVNLYEMLCSARPLLNKFGGHAAAAGLSINKDKLPDLIAACKDYLSQVKNPFKPFETMCDLLADDGFGVATCKQLELLEPFGMGNPKPIFLYENPIKWGRIGQKPHLKSKVGSECEAIAFSKGDSIEVWSACAKRYAFGAELNVFRNTAKANMMIKAAEVDGTLGADMLAIRYLRAALLKAETTVTVAPRKTDEVYGQLVVTFSKEGFDAAKQQYPQHYCVVGHADTLSPDNAIVLSPDELTCFSYFNEVAFYESPRPEFLQYVQSVCGAQIVQQNRTPNLQYPTIDVEKLRSIYITIAKRLQQKVFTSFFELHAELYRTEDGVSYFEFAAAFSVFEELGLINIDKSSMIHITNQKIDLDRSVIYGEICSKNIF